MINGIKESLDEKIEKNSTTLGRTAMHSKSSRVSRLPKYLAVDFVRFYWKPESRVRAKILRKVKFPMDFDASELCTPELQEKMAMAKRRVIALGEEKANAKRLAKTKPGVADASPPADTTAEPASTDKPFSPDPPSTGNATAGASTAFQDALKQKAAERAKPLSEIFHPDLVADEGSNPHGQYDLCAVLTHIGRTLDAGMAGDRR
ncbi:MAG: hypothetical protein BJ554DRAFT_4969 [Olpidium bornovanus]|uniref:ubiquitinyl hydrolase 1 n=1 Tax=Olpidium bornovanus TaxID=278681 RepID=A0A8H7ZK76_9FUNG|nr:MAG: hypothetical protein BJ554DRAFT_4969 [Olpidium bornovanus]